jgi:hypothetical protein
VAEPNTSLSNTPRPVLVVDFNSQRDGGRMWARRIGVLVPGQRVILQDPGEIECDGSVVEVAPRNWVGERCSDYVEVEIIGNWKDLSS